MKNIFQLKKDIKADLGRMGRAKILKSLIRSFSFKLVFWYRIVTYLTNNYPKNRILIYIAKFIHRHYMIKYGVTITYSTKIGGGLKFPHYGMSVINAVRIGENFTIFQGATVGTVRGKGKPIIGDNVIVASNAQVLGAITIGNNVMIGAGAVVVDDVPDNAVVVGNPARIINFDGKRNVSQYLYR